MVCPKCKNSAVLNEVLGKEFYYCRTCKDEVKLQSPPDPMKGLDHLYNDMLYDALKYIQGSGIYPGPFYGLSGPIQPQQSGPTSPQVSPPNTQQAPQNQQNVPTGMPASYHSLQRSHDWSPGTVG